MRIDLIISARDIITLDENRPRATRIGVTAGRIVGFDEELDGVSAAREIDLGGAVAMPGFIDAHCHTTWGGLGLLAVDAAMPKTLDELYDRIREEAERLDAEGDAQAWVHATGFAQANYGGEFPDLKVLDEITGEHPLYLRHTSGHAAITNSVVLRQLGVFEEGFTDPEGGVFVRDREGAPTGLVEEAAQELVQSLILPYPVETIVEAIDAATKQYAALGITSFAEAGIGAGWIAHSPIEVAAYQAASEAGRLHCRAQLMPTIDALHAVIGDETDLGGTGSGRGIDLGIRTGFGDDRVSFGHVKVFTDGSLLGATAAMTEDFCGHQNHGNSGYLLTSPEEQRERTLAAYRAGWAIAIHAIGDRAADLALDIIDEAQRAYGSNGVPNRIEHFGIARPDQVERAGTLGIAVTPQQAFVNVFGEPMAEQIGQDREAWLYRGRSIVESGVIWAGSSDWPVADNDVLRAMQTAVDRVSEKGRVIGPDETVTPEQALKHYTIWAAQAMGVDRDRGTLSPGKLADIVALSASPLEADSIADLDVVATFVGGETTYERDASN